MNRRDRGAASHRAGLAAEEAVAKVYARAGAAILARRWRCAAGEIDLIAREPDALVFIEVKRRAAPIEDDPVSPTQWRRLEKAAEMYIVTTETGDLPLRFDLALALSDGTVEIIKNARI